MPLMIPTKTRMKVATIRWMGLIANTMSPASPYFASALYKVIDPMPLETMKAKITPASPPAKVMTSASARNWNKICFFFAPKRFQHTDLARALLHRDQHDVHQAHAADAQRKRPDERHQDLQPERDDVEHL